MFKHHEWTPTLGALLQADSQVQGCTFTVWSPQAQTVDLHLIGEHDRYVPMTALDKGYFCVVVDGVTPGQRYRYRLDGGDELADPAGRWMPDGINGASAVAARDFAWTDGEWRGLALHDYILYELHIGTFSPEGTYRGAVALLDHLVELGVTAIEIMPVNQFSGRHGWGYDGVYAFAPHNAYGTPDDLKRLIDACHGRGLAVILDVVYNHFGPEGNYMSKFAPYTTDHYRTPWGAAINFDGAYSDEVREYFIENALYWIDEFHIDALRLDATHAMYDFSAVTFIDDLIGRVGRYCGQTKRRVYLIAENDHNRADLVKPIEQGGWGMDAQWNDDFHHALLSNVIGRESSYFEDFEAFESIVKAYREGFVNSGNYVPSRKRRHGSSSQAVTGERFIIFFNNHDQIGNHMPADRLIKTVTFEQYKLMAGAVLLAPYLPMLFMGDEYAETAPFEFFVDFESDALKEAVRVGRRSEFARFLREGGTLPDPTTEATFAASKLDMRLKEGGAHRVMFEFHKALIRLRRSMPSLRTPDKQRTAVIAFPETRLLYLHRWSNDAESDVFALLNFDAEARHAALPVPKGVWRKVIASGDARWAETSDLSQAMDESRIDSNGALEVTLPGYSFAVYTRENAGYAGY